MIHYLINAKLFIADEISNEEYVSDFVKSTKNGSLMFNPVLKDHEGKYICTADNKAGTPLQKTVFISVHGRIIPEVI